MVAIPAHEYCKGPQIFLFGADSLISTTNGIQSDVDNDANCVCTHDFRSVRIKNQTCAYHVRSKNQRYANSFRFYAYSDKMPLNCHKTTTFQPVFFSGCSVNNRKVVTILMEPLIVRIII